MQAAASDGSVRIIVAQGVEWKRHIWTNHRCVCVESEGGQHEETGRVRPGETQRVLGVPKGVTDTTLLWGGEGSVPGVPREEDGKVHH